MRETCKRHVKGDGSWWLLDARGIELRRVCHECEVAWTLQYPPEVMFNPQYEADDLGEDDDDNGRWG